MQRPPFTALAAVYDAIMSDIEYGAWADFVLEYLRSEGVPAATLLDLACGTGASSRPFAERGLGVTGLDRSKEMLAVARRALPGARFVEGDLTSFELNETFDLITCIFDSLNNLTEPGDVLSALRRARAHLRPGGVLAFDVNTRLGVRELWEEGVIEGVAPVPGGGEVHYRWSHHFDAARGLGVVEARCRVGSQAFVELHEERGYDQIDLEPLLAQAGFGQWLLCEFPDYATPPPDAARVWVFAHNGAPGKGLPQEVL